MNTKYPSSKLTLTAISLVAFSTIAGWIGVHGPFGASSNTTPQAQVQTTQAQPSTQQVTVYDDDDDEEERGYTITQQSTTSSAPVARSRGS